MADQQQQQTGGKFFNNPIQAGMDNFMSAMGRANYRQENLYAMKLDEKAASINEKFLKDMEELFKEFDLDKGDPPPKAGEEVKPPPATPPATPAIVPGSQDKELNINKGFDAAGQYLGLDQSGLDSFVGSVKKTGDAFSTVGKNVLEKINNFVGFSSDLFTQDWSSAVPNAILPEHLDTKAMQKKYLDIEKNTYETMEQVFPGHKDLIQETMENELVPIIAGNNPFDGINTLNLRGVGKLLEGHTPYFKTEAQRDRLIETINDLNDAMKKSADIISNPKIDKDTKLMAMKNFANYKTNHTILNNVYNSYVVSRRDSQGRLVMDQNKNETMPNTTAFKLKTQPTLSAQEDPNMFETAYGKAAKFYQDSFIHDAVEAFFGDY